MDKDLLLRELGERIRTRRKAKGMSQNALGLLVGKDQQSIGRIEKGGFNPSYIYLCEIAKGLDTTVSELTK